MSEPHRIDVEDAIDIIKRYRMLNAPDLMDVVFFRDGVQVEIPQQVLNRFSYLGLNNTDFIRDFFLGERFWTSLTLTKNTEPADGRAEGQGTQEG